MTPPTEVNPSPISPTERLDRAQRQLANLRLQIERGNRWTLAIGVLAVALIGGYFIFGYRTIARQLEPRNLVAAAEGLLAERLPDARTALEARLVESAPAIAEALSKQVLANIPEMRRHLEGVVVEQLTAKLKEADALTEQHFRDFIKENRPMIEADLKELAANPKLAEEKLRELEVALDKAFAADLQQQSKAVVKGLVSLNRRMDRLKANKNLGPEEAMERRMVMLFRQLQMEKVDPVLLSIEPSSTDEPRPQAPSPMVPNEAAEKSKPLKK